MERRRMKTSFFYTQEKIIHISIKSVNLCVSGYLRSTHINIRLYQTLLLRESEDSSGCAHSKSFSIRLSKEVFCWVLAHWSLMLADRAESLERVVQALKSHAWGQSKEVSISVIKHWSFKFAGSAGSSERVVQTLKSHAWGWSRKPLSRLVEQEVLSCWLKKL